MKKKMLSGALLGGVLVSVLLILWVVTAHGQLVPKSIKTSSIAQTRLGAILRTVDCDDAYREYQEIDRRHQEKLGICNQMDREQRKRDEESAINLRLRRMSFDSEIFPNTEDWQRRCGAFIERYERESERAEELATTNFWTYWQQCHFEGSSLASLGAARREAEDVVCEKCRDRWPGPDPYHQFCVRWQMGEPDKAR